VGVAGGLLITHGSPRHLKLRLEPRRPRDGP
jgi:hypothetical protein